MLDAELIKTHYENITAIIQTGISSECSWIYYAVRGSLLPTNQRNDEG